MSLYSKALEKIPKGTYCYERLEMNEDKISLRVINPCPFHHYNEFFGLFECQYLKQYGIPNHEMYDGWREDLISYFGSEEKVFEATPLDLLFDSIKECGINNEV